MELEVVILQVYSCWVILSSGAPSPIDYSWDSSYSTFVSQLWYLTYTAFGNHLPSCPRWWIHVDPVFCWSHNKTQYIDKLSGESEDSLCNLMYNCECGLSGICGASYSLFHLSIRNMNCTRTIVISDVFPYRLLFLQQDFIATSFILWTWLCYLQFIVVL